MNNISVENERKKSKFGGVKMVTCVIMSTIISLFYNIPIIESLGLSAANASKLNNSYCIYNDYAESFDIKDIINSAEHTWKIVEKESDGSPVSLCYIPVSCASIKTLSNGTIFVNSSSENFTNVDKSSTFNRKELGRWYQTAKPELLYSPNTKSYDNPNLMNSVSYNKVKYNGTFITGTVVYDYNSWGFW